MMTGRGGGGLLMGRIVVFSLLQLSTIVTPSSSLGSDYRNVPYEALVHNMEQFTETGVGHFSEILFDVKRYQLIVGARDALFRLSMDGLKKLEKADWPASSQNIGLCTAKGQSEEMCRNYVKVLVSHQDQVFACGTHAFSPKCSWREPGEIGKVTRLIDGRAKCPYSPGDNATALITSDGDYFIGSATDFQSTDHAIYRMKGHNVDLYTLRTVQYDSKWLAQPDFVAQFETKDFVYFVFRETAAEVMNCGKAIYSRIARVCKNDQGGSSVLKNQWTTFLKARLNCSMPGEFPFYYNEIQSAVYLESEGMVYATFTTGSNSIAGAAICNFNMTAIEEAFMGDFKYQSNAASTWSPAKADHEHFQCSKRADGDDLLSSTKYQLMDSSVQSVLPPPLYDEKLNRFGQIAVDTVHIKHQDNQPVHVVFVATEDGSIKKIAFNPSTKETCLIEKLWPFPGTERPVVRNMKLLSHSSSPTALYIATDQAVIRLPVQRCARFKTNRDCLNAMDPYCGWNKQKNECVTAPNKNPNVGYWQQNLIRCPILTDPVDGGWGDWSDWDTCAFDNPDTRVNSKGDYCRCRTRACDSPVPANGGMQCRGSELVVTNCTQHGGWTSWSQWSGCSQSCGMGLKTRHRQCGNPVPAYGGNVCVGRDVDEQYCDDLPQCDSHVASTLYHDTHVSATWSQWSDWSTCSAKCGVGYKSRSRKCYGVGCSGCDRDFETCENTACSDYIDVTETTPWINVTNDVGGWEEKRWTFTYTSLASINKAAGRVAEERQYCYAPGRCTMIGGTPAASRQSDFSDWSSCSRSCGGGRQWRVRTCGEGRLGCVGTSLLEQVCNTHPCDGHWSCWSDWSRCTGGRRSRDRSCEAGDQGGSAVCSGGQGHQEEDCGGEDGGWSAWGDCEAGVQTRTSTDGEQETQTRVCDGDLATPLQGGAGASVNIIVGACVIGFMLGSVVGAGLVYYYFKVKKNGGLNPPHYISAKSQNLYVSLPMLDLNKHKQLSSNHSDYSGTLRSNNGTMRSNKANSSIYTSKPGDYETATIKRSHSRRDSSLINNSSIRADLDSDQLFT